MENEICFPSNYILGGLFAFREMGHILHLHSLPNDEKMQLCVYLMLSEEIFTEKLKHSNYKNLLLLLFQAFVHCIFSGGWGSSVKSLY